METGKKFKNSQLAELGKVLPVEGTTYHSRVVKMANGDEGNTYGSDRGGPEDPLLLILEKLMNAADSVAYTIKESKTPGKFIIMFNHSPKEAAAELAKDKADKAKPKNTSPSANTGTEPPAQNFPAAPPAERTKQTDPADDPFMGYGNRNALLDAKDHYFRWLEKYKMVRDEKADAEFSWRYYLSLAVEIVRESGKKLAPNEVADTAWTLALELYNRYQKMDKTADGFSE